MGRPATAAVRLLAGEREPVRVASVADLILAGLQTVDGVALAINDRVLVKNQADQRTNGIWTASEGMWHRASDASFSRAITEGVTVAVQEGGQGGQAFRFRNPSPQIGIDPIDIDFYLSGNFAEDAEAVIEANKMDLLAYAEDRRGDLIDTINAEEAGALGRVAASSNAAAISAGQALGARNQAVAAEGRAGNLVDAAQAAYVGFQPGTFYDLGRVTDPVQLFPSDLGRVTDAA